MQLPYLPTNSREQESDSLTQCPPDNCSTNTTTTPHVMETGDNNGQQTVTSSTSSPQPSSCKPVASWTTSLIASLSNDKIRTISHSTKAVYPSSGKHVHTKLTPSSSLSSIHEGRVSASSSFKNLSSLPGSRSSSPVSPTGRRNRSLDLNFVKGVYASQWEQSKQLKIPRKPNLASSPVPIALSPKVIHPVYDGIGCKTSKEYDSHIVIGKSEC